MSGGRDTVPAYAVSSAWRGHCPLGSQDFRCGECIGVCGVCGGGELQRTLRARGRTGVCGSRRLRHTLWRALVAGQLGVGGSRVVVGGRGR